MGFIASIIADVIFQLITSGSADSGTTAASTVLGV